MRNLVLALFVLGAVAAACGEGSTTGPEPLCNATETKVCACPDGKAGTQVCNADGTAWGECSGCETDDVVEEEILEGCNPTCSPGYECKDKVCVCIPQCTGKQCGPDGCGGQCGTCLPNQMCDEKGLCVCKPQCDGKNCGPDGCNSGGTCGTCAQTQECNASGVCESKGGECWPNACIIDAHCEGCPGGQNKCWADNHLCVECHPGKDQECPAGLKCSANGKCTTKDCPTNPQGEPTLNCTKDSDCEACSPKNQACDIAKGKCVQCVSLVDPHCLDSQYCKNGICEPKCPQSCEVDVDCMQCLFGATGGPDTKPAKACNNHKCAECSKTWPCPEGMVCLANGVCYPPCGIPGPVQGTCTTDGDCKFCGDPDKQGTFKCKKPVNDPNGHGTCIPSAQGCEDLGAGVAVLPSPWNQYTELCSDDGNCASISIDYNVGKLIRDLIGTNEVMGITIGDATVKYGMNQCAEINLTSNIGCGVCVPCEIDKDCKPIPIDPLIVDLFKGNALAQIAGLMLINMLWGDNEDHNLYLYCQPVGLGYGVCAPCSNPLQNCGKTEGGGSGNCGHDVCTQGDPLDPKCGACAKEVCAIDNYCCSTAWDKVCVDEVDQYCTTPCGGQPGCAADICANVNLPAQNPACGACVKAVCDADPFCCNTQGGAWDKYCVDAAKTNQACATQCGGGCGHDECVTGGPLEDGCSDCVSSVCAGDEWCCTNEWDSVCVDEAKADGNCDC